MSEELVLTSCCPRQTCITLGLEDEPWGLSSLLQQNEELQHKLALCQSTPKYTQPLIPHPCILMIHPLCFLPSSNSCFGCFLLCLVNSDVLNSAVGFFPSTLSVILYYKAPVPLNTVMRNSALTAMYVAHVLLHCYNDSLFTVCLCNIINTNLWYLCSIVFTWASCHMH